MDNYDEQNRIISKISLVIHYSFYNKVKMTFNYDDSGRLINERTYSYIFSDTSHWKLDTEKSWNFDNDGNLIEYIEESSSGCSKEIYSYNSNNNIIQIDYTNNSSISTYRTKYTYDKNNNRIEQLDQFFEDSIWVNNYLQNWILMKIKN
jgi:hypothetical protein